MLKSPLNSSSAQAFAEAEGLGCSREIKKCTRYNDDANAAISEKIKIHLGTQTSTASLDSLNLGIRPSEAVESSGKL